MRVLFQTATGIFFLLSGGIVFSQPGARIDLPKPEKYQNRSLASEKSTVGKMNPLKKFNQNINTRFNFHFNASNELNEVVYNARTSFKDDYSRLLPFYDYTLEQTAGSKSELDSVILKCNNGILLHDLRNDWVDDLYLLMGKAYFFRNELDSAAIAFQYINYAFQPRDKDEIGFDKPIGSNQNRVGNIYTISTPEKKGLIPRTITHTPARNEAIEWLLRTLIEQDRMNEAGSLIETLRRDPVLPENRRVMLHEMQALWFYRSDIPDSAAYYLEKSLDNAADNRDRSRREFLAAQLYEKAGMIKDADRLYEKAVGHTTDLVMEAYARINQVSLQQGKDDAEKIRSNLEELSKMARKSKYEDYRHIIHYASARLELQRNEPAAAISQYKKSVASNSTDAKLKNRAFIEMGDLSYSLKDYRTSFDSYDSADLAEVLPDDKERVESRKPVLADIVSHLENIRREDSLRKIALLPENERTAYLKSLVKKLRKEMGIREEDPSMDGGGAGNTSNLLKDNEPVNLFASNENKGEWYFYNSGLRSQGFRQFQARWGKRPNLDNWRRMAAVNNQLNATTVNALESPDMNITAGKATEPESKQPREISVQALSADLPLTEEARRLSDDTIQSSLFRLGMIFREKMDDCTESINYLETLLNRYPRTTHLEEALYELSVCHRKNGNTGKAAFYRDHLTRNFSKSNYLLKLDNPELARKQELAREQEITDRYDEVYRLMIEGRFGEAFRLKGIADSTYGENHWSPQLLYVEAVYHVRSGNDSLALQSLNRITTKYKGSPMAAKAATMTEVLKKRKEIEDYLTRQDIKRLPEDSILIDLPPDIKTRETVAVKENKPLPIPAVEKKPVIRSDTAALKAPQPAPRPATGSTYVFNPTDPHLVALILDNVDVVYLNEARRALARYNSEKSYDQPLEVSSIPYSDNMKILGIRPFSDVISAMSYLEKARNASATDIFPWLPADKYRFILLSESNLGLLQTKKNLEEYMKFLRDNLPGKF
jgi:tetratricopeptide (TPR) repeat protein